MVIATGPLGAPGRRRWPSTSNRRCRPAAAVAIEGKRQGDWVLIDAGDVIVHLFRPEIRAYYNLEKMWGAALPESRRRPKPRCNRPRPRGQAAIRLHLIAVGRLRRGPLCDLQALYAERIVPPVAIIEVEEKRRLPPAELKRRARPTAPRRAAGRRPSRRARRARHGAGRAASFADRLAAWRDGGAAALAFAIGGADGLGASGRRARRRGALARPDDLAASPGARHAAGAALPRPADPRRPSLSPGVTRAHAHHRHPRHRRADQLGDRQRLYRFQPDDGERRRDRTATSSATASRSSASASTRTAAMRCRGCCASASSRASSRPIPRRCSTRRG